MLPGAVTQKLGPLPVWAWGLLVGAGVLGWAYLHHGSSTAAADQAAADAAAGDTTGTATDAGNLQNVDGTNPLDFAGPTSGAFGGGDSFAPAPPANARLDPAQWRRIQAELAAIRKWERHHSHTAPKHHRHRGTPRVVASTMQQPSRQRPRATGQVVNSGSGQLP